MDATAAGVPDAEERTQLKRVIGVNLLFFFVLGDMLGGGIYSLVGEIAAEVGGAAWTSFVGAFVLALFTALSYAELVTKYPYAAGAALYVHRAFKTEFLTFMVTFLVMASGITSASFLAKAFASDYFATFVSAPVIGVALALFAVITIINLIGISESTKVNAAITCIEVTGLIIIMVVGVASLFSGDADPSRSLQFHAGESPLLLLFAGTSLAFYALIGFEDSVNVAEETRDPRRAFPRALIGALLIAGAIYVVVGFISTMVVSVKQLSGSDAPLLEVVKEGPIAVPETLFSLIALFALSNGALINMIMASRLVYGMSNQGVLPGVFRGVLPGRRTPWAAIAFTTAIGVVLIATTGDLGILADTTVLLLLTVFAFVNVAVLVLRRDEIEEQHFRTPTVFPILGAVISIALVVQTLLSESGRAIYVRAGVILLLGLVMWVINRLTGGGKRELEAEKLAG